MIGWTVIIPKLEKFGQFGMMDGQVTPYYQQFIDHLPWFPWWLRVGIIPLIAELLIENNTEKYSFGSNPKSKLNNFGGWACPSEKWWSSSVGMIIQFPTEWKVKKIHGSKPRSSKVLVPSSFFVATSAGGSSSSVVHIESPSLQGDPRCTRSPLAVMWTLLYEPIRRLYT